MVSLHLLPAVLLCLSFVRAEPFHIPLVRKRTLLSVEGYADAANALKKEYSYSRSSISKRQSTVGIDQVCPPCAP